MVRDCKDEPFVCAEKGSLSCQIQMNTLFNNNDGRKRRKYDINIHKAMIIPDNIYQTNEKSFVKVQQKTHIN